MTEGNGAARQRSAAGDDATGPQGGTSTAGDLEFDEAWSEPRQGHDATREPPAREVPTFEDPNER